MSEHFLTLLVSGQYHRISLMKLSRKTVMTSVTQQSMH